MLPPLFAAGFASGLMLLWMAAGAIPIAIHLLTRRQQVQRKWAAMQLLLDVLEKEAKRVRFEQLLLLLLRVLILLLLGFTLARPFLSTENTPDSANSSRPSRLWIIGIDATYSMGYREDDTSRFQEAKQQAMRLVQSSREGDAFTLVELASPCRAVIQFPTFSRENMLTEIARLRQLNTGASMVECYQQMIDIAERAEQVEGLPRDIRTVIYSDLGKDSWLSLETEAGTQLVEELSSSTTLEIVSVAAKTPRNSAITAIAPSTNSATVGKSVQVAVSVAHFGSDTVRIPLQFTVDENDIASQEVTLSAGSTKTITFDFTPGRTGSHIVSAKISSDNLIHDNARSHIIQVRERHRILAVEEARGDSELVLASLIPDGFEKPNIQIETTPAIEVAAANLQEYQAVILCDLASIDSQLADRLTEYAATGGGVICLFGKRTRASTWNSQQTNPLGFRLLNSASFGPWTIDAMDYASPIVAPFNGFPDAGLLTTPIFKYWQVDQVHPNAIVDLSLTNKAPLLVRNPIGEGSIASLLSAPESGAANPSEELPSWNAMASWPSFVPLMNQLLRTVVESKGTQYNLLASQPLRGRAPIEVAGNIAIVQADGNARSATPNLLSGDNKLRAGTQAWSFRETQVQGIYRAESGEYSEIFAVNVDPVESSLRSVSSRKFTQFVNEASQSNTADISKDAPPVNNSLARVLLLALLTLVILESFLARWMGNRAG